MLVGILLPQDLKFAFFAVSGIDIATHNPDRFAGQSNQSLDVVFLRVFRIAKDNHVPSFGIADLIGKLVDENSISLEDGKIVDVIQFAAIGADRIVDPSHQVSVVIQFVARADFVFVVAFGTDNVLVATKQRRCHRTGGDDKCFGNKRSKEQRENEGKGDRFQRFARGILRRPVAWLSRRGRCRLVRLRCRRGSRTGFAHAVF